MPPWIQSPNGQKKFIGRSLNMVLFKRLYDKTLHCARHDHAPYYLAGVSFVESSFFPIPPDVMLIPMVLSKPTKAWNFAWITTIASIIGGLFGYAIGYFAFAWVGEPIIVAFHYESLYESVALWFDKYGIFAVSLAAFTPIPYKLFTLAAGATQMPLLGFVFASCIGRSMRFFGVVAFVKFVGIKMEPVLVKYMEWIGWLVVLFAAILFIGYWLYAR